MNETTFPEKKTTEEHKRQVIRSLCGGRCSPDADCFKCLDNWLKQHGEDEDATACTNKEEFSKADRIELVPVTVKMAERGAGKAAFEKAKYTAKLNYRQGEWDMFVSITSVWYGKQCYFREDNGMVYSRISARHIPRDEAIKEFIDKIGE